MKIKQFTPTFGEFLNEGKKKKKHILTHRRSKEERSEKLKATINKKIQKYIKNGCKGHLNLHQMPITELPDNLYVGGDLDLTDTQIVKLPNKLRVRGSLYLRFLKITELPDDLEVGGDLDLLGTQITKLPNRLKVGGMLRLLDTQITKLPDDLEVKGNIYKRF